MCDDVVSSILFSVAGESSNLEQGWIADRVSTGLGWCYSHCDAILSQASERMDLGLLFKFMGGDIRVWVNGKLAGQNKSNREEEEE